RRPIRRGRRRPLRGGSGPSVARCRTPAISAHLAPPPRRSGWGGGVLLGRPDPTGGSVALDDPQLFLVPRRRGGNDVAPPRRRAQKYARRSLGARFRARRALRPHQAFVGGAA